MKKKVRTFDPANIEYLKGLLGEEAVEAFFKVENKPWRCSQKEKKTCETVKACLEHMETFGENRWWLSEDKRVLGYYQLQCSRLLVPWDKFVNALDVLLGRGVYTHEFAWGREALRAEAERAFNGKPDSEEEKARTVQKSIEKLVDSGIPVMVVEV